MTDGQKLTSEKLFDEILSQVKEPKVSALWPWNPWAGDSDHFSFFHTLSSLEEVHIKPLFESIKLRDDYLFVDVEKESLSESEESLFHILNGTIGSEAIAFYKSYRYKDSIPYSGKWGIFYSVSGIKTVINDARNFYKGLEKSLPNEFSKMLSLRTILFLRQHEYFHYLSDIRSLLIEKILDKPLRSALGQTYDPLTCCEETLANKRAFEWAKDNEIEDYASYFISCQPGSYSKIDQSDENLKIQWISDLLEGRQNTTHLVSDANYYLPIPPEVDCIDQCPEHLVFSDATTWLARYNVYKNLVTEIIDSESVKKILRKDKPLGKLWEKTKTKIISNPAMNGLNLKEWHPPKTCPKTYSIRVNDNFRAHLQPRSVGNSIWETKRLGSHKELGHG